MRGESAGDNLEDPESTRDTATPLPWAVATTSSLGQALGASTGWWRPSWVHTRRQVSVRDPTPHPETWRTAGFAPRCSIILGGNPTHAIPRSGMKRKIQELSQTEGNPGGGQSMGRKEEGKGGWLLFRLVGPQEPPAERTWGRALGGLTGVGFRAHSTRG